MAYACTPHATVFRCNVDMLKLIQIGLCLTNENGELPSINGELCLWQFNFRHVSVTYIDIPHQHHLSTHREFRLADDLYAQDSIDLLRQSGINFAQNEARGIEVQQFGELLMSSGIVLNEDVCRCMVVVGHSMQHDSHPLQVRWITFHSGYDFGYLLKALTCQPLPDTEDEFFQLLKVRMVNTYTCIANNNLHLRFISPTSSTSR